MVSHRSHPSLSCYFFSPSSTFNNFVYLKCLHQASQIKLSSFELVNMGPSNQRDSQLIHNNNKTIDRTTDAFAVKKDTANIIADTASTINNNDNIKSEDEDDDFTNDLNSMNEGDSMLNIQQLLVNFEENEPIFDNELLYPSPKESEVVHFKDGHLIHGTAEALITYLTSPEVLNYQFLVDFFLTFRTYIDALPLLELLLCRLSWCMKKSLLSDPEQSSVGRLILIRTFVTIRHWLLNHFQDDFVNNSVLRSLFTHTINELGKHKKFIGNDHFNLQSKIIKDLKKNYLTLASIYWDIDVSQNSNEDLLDYRISSYDDFNTSRLSAMGLNQLHDPSTRRSTLLYMLENPSSNNILNESLKKNAYINSTNIKPTPTSPSPSHVNHSTQLETFLNKYSGCKNKVKSKREENFVLYPKDSLYALDRSKMKNKANSINDTSSIDQLYTTLFAKESIPGFVPLNKVNSSSSVIDGFAISGNIEIYPDSKIHKIMPMRNGSGKNNNIVREKTGEINVTSVSKLQTHETGIKPISEKAKTATIKNNGNISNVSSNLQRSKSKKKSFLKSFFQQHDKENFYGIQPQSQPTSNSTSMSSKIDSTYMLRNESSTMSQSSDFSTKPSSKMLNLAALIEKLENQLTVNENTIDYLEDIVIRDYQVMIQHPSYKQRYSKQTKNSNRRSVLSMAFDFNDRDCESRFNPLDSPTKISNLNFSGNPLELSTNPREPNAISLTGENTESVANEKSFQTPPDTIDWSNSIDADQSQNPEFVDMGILNNNDISAFDRTCNSNKNIPQNNQQLFKHKRSSLQYCPQSRRISILSRKNKHNSDSRILLNINNPPLMNSYSSLNDANFTDSVNGLNNRFSVNIIGRSSLLSNKSYMTYDSEFSADSKDAYNLNLKLGDEKQIKKKDGISNLRITNLDFDVSNDSVDDLNSQEVNITLSEGTRGLDESLAMLNNFNELPYFDAGDDDSESLGSTSMNHSTSSISILPSPTPSQTCYNGLSQTDINELAAIPDEKLDDDPLNYTLSKLRGERSKFKVIVGLNDTKPNDEKIHRKHAVAVVCQSPTKRSFTQPNILNTLNDEYYNNKDEDSSNDEIKLENQIRDLYISQNPNDISCNDTATAKNHKDCDYVRSTNSVTSKDIYSKLEMNVLSRQSGDLVKESDNTITRVSTGKILRDDGERSCFDIQSLSATPKALGNCKPILTVKQILEAELHIPFIFKYDSTKLAHQMTLIERDIILEVEWKELINLKWDQPLIPYNSWLKLLLNLSDKTGLELITLRFNLVNNWIISEILLCKNITLRVLAIARFIQLAEQCRQIQNYSTLFQIMLALNSEVMKQLKSTWIRIDPGTILKFKELKDLTSPNNNFKKYRDEIEDIVPSKGFIPFLPLGLSDLTMYSEMPTIISSNSTDLISELDPVAEFETSSNINFELINFEKFKLTGETVKKILRYIEWSRFYDFETDKEVISKCLYISSLSEEDMALCLQELVD